jgi:hypothetical protein
VSTSALIQSVVSKSGIQLDEIQKKVLVEAQLSWASQLDVARQLGILDSTFQRLLIQAAQDGNVVTYFNLTEPIPPDVQRLGFGEPADSLKLGLLLKYANKQLVAGHDNDIVATAQRLGVLETARESLVALAVKYGSPSLYAGLMPSPEHCPPSELAQLMENAERLASLAHGDSEEGRADSR